MLLYGVSFSAAALLLAVDQWSKYWTDNNMELGEVRPLLGAFLELHCVHNYGVAWSLFSGMRWVLAAVSGCIVIAVAAMLLLRMIRHPLGVCAAFLLLSGGIGNLLDRIALGYVVDMLRFAFWRSYPTFNVADICVVSGCVLWLIYALAVKEEPIEARRRESRDSGAARYADSTDQAASGADQDDDDFYSDFHFDSYRSGSVSAEKLSSSRESQTPLARESQTPFVQESKTPLPRESYRGTNDDWQEKWRQRQRERRGRR